MSTPASLLKLQQGFARFLAGEHAPDLVPHIAANALGAEARLQIYKNAMFQNLTTALQTAYPVVRSLVGDEFFDGSAMRYIRDYPSRSGNLQDYGDAFPGFLAAMPEARSVPYLGDVAQLEWARQKSYMAADAAWLAPDATPLDINRPAPAALLLLHPSVRLLLSAYPILDIWLYCHTPSAEAPPTLDDDGQQVLIWRDGSQVAMQELEPGAATFIEAILAGDPVSQALAATGKIQPDGFDLASCLLWLFDTHLVTGVLLPNHKSDLRNRT